MSEVERHPLATCCWCGAHFIRGAIEVYGLVPWMCPTEACWQRQVTHAMVVTLKGKEKRCRFVPLPRQVEAMEAVDGAPTFILFGGARGGSKSKCMREIAHRKGMTINHFRVLILRRTFKELDENHLRDVELEAPELDADWIPSARLLRYKTGATLRFGHCETAADAANYLSSEYDLIIFDELVTFEETQYLLIGSSARSTKAGVVPKILAATNPGGPQSHWVRQRFIDKTVDTTDFPDYAANEHLFIRSKLEDNPYLDKAYERKLLALPPELRKAYRDGDWDIFPGQYFPEWRKKTHISTDAKGDPVHLAYPTSYQRVCAVDWGFVKPGICGWWVLLSDGQVYREDEYVFTRTIAAEVAKEIKRRSVARGIRVKYTVGDTQMWTPDSQTGESIADTFARSGVPMQQADKDRLNGWQRLRAWFTMAPDGRPWMQSSPHCVYFNRTIPALISDTHKPEDVDTDGEDHAGDESRYFVMSRPSPAVLTIKVSPPAGSPAAIMAKLRAKMSHRTWGTAA